MAVKVLHSADFHMDSAFDSLPEDKAALRRREQRELLWRIAELSNSRGADIVLLSGDLFDSAVSYYETYETLLNVLSGITAEIFISPGNHDYFCPRSPYSFLDFPDNVHIFKTPIISSFELPELGCRVYGAGFNAPRCLPLLSGFHAEEDGLINLMTIHGDLGGDMYNHISEEEISESGLDYLALGHTHSFSGIKTAGKTAYAYPGCPEGRGFDETGRKGILFGAVDKGSVDLEFVPVGGRQYRIYELDLTGRMTAVEAVRSQLPSDGTDRDIVRVILKGIYAGKIDINELTDAVSDRFFHVTFKDETRLGYDIWDSMADNTLTGMCLRRMRAAFESAESDEAREAVVLAVRYGLAALENREEWRP